MDVDIFAGMSMNIEFVAPCLRALMIITSICLMNRKGLMFIRILSFCCTYFNSAALHLFLKLAFCVLGVGVQFSRPCWMFSNGNYGY